MAGLIAIFVPLGGAFLLPLLGRISSRARNLCALGLILVSLGCSLALVPGALRGASVRFILPGFLGISFSLSADALAVFMAMVMLVGILR